MAEPKLKGERKGPVGGVVTRVAVRVSFRKFYPGFRPSAYFVPLIEAALGTKVDLVPCTQRSDLELVSVYQQTRPWMGRATSYVGRELLGDGSISVNDSSPSHLAGRSIWYTAENTRPPLGDWNATWSFDVDSKTLKNVHFPLWWLLFPELLPAGEVQTSPEDRIGRDVSLQECLSNRVPDVADRPGFLCAFVGNPEPTRMRALTALTEIGQVDIYGSWSARPVATKGEVARNYRFMLCFENDIWPGYVTEKAIDAWACGCVPVWCGLDPEGYLNPNALVNHAELRSLENLTESIAHLEANRDALTRMASSPILVRRPSLAGVIDSLREVMSS